MLTRKRSGNCCRWVIERGGVCVCLRKLWPVAPSVSPFICASPPVCDAAGATCLIKAVQRGHDSLITLLLHRKADVRHKTTCVRTPPPRVVMPHMGFGRADPTDGKRGSAPVVSGHRCVSRPIDTHTDRWVAAGRISVRSYRRSRRRLGGCICPIPVPARPPGPARRPWPAPWRRASSSGSRSCWTPVPLFHFLISPRRRSPNPSFPPDRMGVMETAR